jgi:hypothetical protein
MTNVPSQSAPDGSVSQQEPPDPDETVPASDPGQVGEALQNASPGDDLATAAEEGSISAGEAGRAVDAASPATSRPDVEVIIGEIPDARDITVLRWTARCSNPEHDLLGHFDLEQEARQAKEEHLASQH